MTHAKTMVHAVGLVDIAQSAETVNVCAMLVAISKMEAKRETLAALMVSAPTVFFAS